MKYFEVLVEEVVSTDPKTGKDKKQKTAYLVDAMSVTEAEARIVKLYSGVSVDYRVVGAKESKIAEVVSQ
jgi:hypothetical protein